MRPPAVPSPCIYVCRIDQKTGFCQGCWRTLAEISFWTRMSEAERLAVMEDLPRRRAAGQAPG
jgi:predicted Fe-S protein YdhL (DUF1289 family)